MRHMEMYKGCRAEFDCGFSHVEENQSAQINNLRMRYATKIMASPASIISYNTQMDAMVTEYQLKKKEKDGKKQTDVEDDEALMSFIDEEYVEVVSKLRNIEAEVELDETVNKKSNVTKQIAKVNNEKVAVKK
jgi:CII-binding regulator of phage lambda lysogenization HflD